MPTIVLDTNIVGVRLPLANNDVRRLLDEAKQKRVQVAVPELVIQEALNCWAEKLASRDDRREAAIDELRKLGVDVSSLEQELNHEQLRQDEESRVRAALAGANVRVLPVPSTSHQLLVQRALDRRQPFDREGKDGYRDALIWENVVELAAAGEDVFLVSNDIPAFYKARKDKEAGLDPQLKLETEERAPSGSVALYFSPSDALDAALEIVASASLEAEQRDSELRTRLQGALAHEEGLQVLTLDAIDDALRNLDVGNLRDYGFGVDTYASTIDIVEDLSTPKVLATHLTSDGFVLAQIEVSGIAEVDVLVSPGEAALVESDPRFDLLDPGFDSGVAKGTAFVALQARADLVFQGSGESFLPASLATIDFIGPRAEEPPRGRITTIDDH